MSIELISLDNAGQPQPVNYTKLLEVLVAKGPAPGTGNTFAGIIEARGSVYDALVFYPLFFPPLVEYHGRIYHELARTLSPHSNQTSRVAKTKKMTKRGKERQALANHIHPSDLFGFSRIGRSESQGQNVAIEEAEVRMLTQCLAVTWRLWLDFNYPNRQFVVDAFDPFEDPQPGDDWSIDDFQLTFYEDRVPAE